MSDVSVKREPIELPTYEPMPPDKHPMFLERRVYQGSSGAVYPLPFCDRISERRQMRTWDAIWLENEYLQIMILPEIGGRIHVGRDKTNDYDFFYRQDVIKPALVGLAGPWISGGVEFNWPQHHRPATYLPVDVEIVHADDGSVTVWCSDHDPMTRMKGMHGVTLHPGKALIELKVRLYNRTEQVQTFLWWANAATRVHNAYQSFFPPDVTHVADHARRAMSAYPLCQGRYYGVDYGARAKNGVTAEQTPSHDVPPHCGGASPVAYAPNDLSFYANIPVPTSYMCIGTQEDFFGGYDYAADAGLIHIADHRIAPGKKQWTWGNHAFGYAWDRNLTDADADGEYAPYIELMAGVFSDNQPDFSYLMPGETKAWSQYWYPIQKIGPAQQATCAAALSLHVAEDQARLGVAATAVYAQATIAVFVRDVLVAQAIWDLSPAMPYLATVALPADTRETEVEVVVTAADGRSLVRYRPQPKPNRTMPEPAHEPALPQDVASSDELYLIGVHLAQYRHATRDPAPYWQEALRRDPDDSRCHTALGRWHLRRGEFDQAEGHFRRAISRLTRLNANPRDGEAFYQLGLTLRFLGREAEAFDAFAKACWNQAWQASAHFALAELSCRRRDFRGARDHLAAALKRNADDLKARDLLALTLRSQSQNDEAQTILNQTQTLDPLDWWARDIAGEPLSCDTQTRIDIALDDARAGFYADAIRLLQTAAQQPQAGTAPLVHYHLAWLYEQSGNAPAAAIERQRAMQADLTYCFPARLEEIRILQDAIVRNPDDGNARYYLGNLFYAKRRHEEAVALWRQATARTPNNSVAWRNLGIGQFNICHDPKGAVDAYDRALACDPTDARLLYERDQLWKRIGITPKRRLDELERHRVQVAERDDLSVELCALYNLTGRPTAARAILSRRRFQPWEGGEGLVLAQHVATQVALGRQALADGRTDQACTLFAAALEAPENLGEAHHVLANRSDVLFWLGTALTAAGRETQARRAWQRAADHQGDFRAMSVRPYSDMTFFSALALRALGRHDQANALLRELLQYAEILAKTPAKIDYFSTSLPTMLLFEDDIQARQQTQAQLLAAQAYAGLGETATAETKLADVLLRDPNHLLAKDMLTMLASGTLLYAPSSVLRRRP